MPGALSAHDMIVNAAALSVDATRRLYSPQVDRETLNVTSLMVTEALRDGDRARASQLLHNPRRAPGLSVADAVLGIEHLHTVPWSPAPAGPGRTSALLVRTGGFGQPLAQLLAELELRGVTRDRVIMASPQELQPNDAGTLLVRGEPQAMPEAAMSIDAPPEAMPLLHALRGAGVHVVNGTTGIGRDKSLMAHLFQRTGVNAPETVSGLRTVDELVAAAHELGGWPLVLKHPRSSASRHVEVITSEQQLRETLERWERDQDLARDGTRPSKIGLLLQRKLDMGRRDVRFHGARDLRTGELRPVGATDRVGIDPDDIRANGGPAGNKIRPIHDLSGADPILTPDMIDVGLRADDAAGLDSYSADIGRDRATGRPVIIEVDTWPHPLELNQPVPPEQQTLPRLADLLVYG